MIPPDQKGYDPILRAAMHEIESVCNKYDCGAVVVLGSKTHGEFKLLIEPSWSNARWIRGETAIHIKLHSKSDHERTRVTVGMLFSMQEMIGRVFLMLDKIKAMVEKHAVVEHTNGPINNDDR